MLAEANDCDLNWTHQPEKYLIAVQPCIETSCWESYLCPFQLYSAADSKKLASRMKHTLGTLLETEDPNLTDDEIPFCL